MAIAAVVALVAVAVIYERTTSAADAPVFQAGVTHTQHSADAWNPQPSVDRARAVLRAVAPLQNQHLMGWGALNPEPSPGRFDFHSLDARMNMIAATGRQPVLTLCCAPDWMKEGAPGTSDWSRLEVAPTPDHYDDFARLAAVAAKRYPKVRYFLVWNELKGFYDHKRNDWDIAAYTNLYNRVYQAVKRVRPDAQIGGPYVVFDSWSAQSKTSHRSALHGPWGVVDQRALNAVDYWLTHAVGADFVAVDGRTPTRDRGLVTTDFAAVDKFVTVTRWLRSRTALPIWWAEIKPAAAQQGSAAADGRAAAVMADALVAVAHAGASVALLWQPQASAHMRGPALFTDSTTSDGGRALPLVTVLRALKGPLAKNPGSIRTSWDAVKGEWRAVTPEWTFTWSQHDGLRGPEPTR